MTTFQLQRSKDLHTPDPNYERKVRNSFNHQGVMQALKGELIDVQPGYIEIHIPFTPQVAQQHGFFHGGIVATIADSASGYAAYTVLEPGEECLSAEFKVNFLSPAKGEKMIARASVIKPGRTLVIAQATVSVLVDGQEKECALMIHTLARAKHMKSPSEASI